MHGTMSGTPVQPDTRVGGGGNVDGSRGGSRRRSTVTAAGGEHQSEAGADGAEDGAVMGRGVAARRWTGDKVARGDAR